MAITEYDNNTLHYDLKTPCDDCPFRRDTTHPYTVNGLLEWLQAIAMEQSVGHTCHKTDARADCESAKNYTGPLQHCAGALIMLRKTRAFMMPDYLCDALASGAWKFRQMDMTANVYTLREIAEKTAKAHDIEIEL